MGLLLHRKSFRSLVRDHGYFYKTSMKVTVTFGLLKPSKHWARTDTLSSDVNDQSNFVNNTKMFETLAGMQTKSPCLFYMLFLFSGGCTISITACRRRSRHVRKTSEQFEATCGEDQPTGTAR